MQVDISEYSVRIVVVAPQGRVDAFNALDLRRQLEYLLDDGVSRFVLDLSAVPFLDSAGMAVLVSLLKQARTRGGDVKLVGPTAEAAQRILRLTKFDRVFMMAETVAAATASF